MIIAIDGTTLCDPSGDVGAGIEHYTWEITRALLKMETSHTFLIATPSVLSSVRTRTLLEGARSRVRVIRSFGSKISFLSHHILMPLQCWFRRADVFFAPNGQLPLGWRGHSVITIHDVAIYDHPEWFATLPNQDFSTQVIVPRSIAQADRILAVTEATRTRLVDRFKEAELKTCVIYEGVCVPEGFSLARTSDRFPFDRDFVLFVGTIEPRKNITAALEAFHLFLIQHPESSLKTRCILAGKKGWRAEEVFACASKINRAWKHVDPEGVVQWLGTVTEEEKWTLYARASVLVYPSFYEGFGLPVLEAMASGTPVIIMHERALEEVGGDAVIVVNDLESMSLAMAQCLLLPEGVAFLKEEGRARANNFSWERAAAETLQAIESIKKVVSGE